MRGGGGWAWAGLAQADACAQGTLCNCPRKCASVLGVPRSVLFKKEPETMDGGKGKEKATGLTESGSNEALKETVAELVREALAEQLEKARAVGDKVGAAKDSTGTKNFSRHDGMTGQPRQRRPH